VQIQRINSAAMPFIPTIAAINCGSSSLKFGLFTCTNAPRILVNGSITGIGGDKPVLAINGEKKIIPAKTVKEAAAAIFKWMNEQDEKYEIVGIGHRLVHGGMAFSEPELITTQLIKALEQLKPMAPQHLPDALTVMDISRKTFPNIPHIACFDTAFHAQMPFEARYFALPRELWEEGVLRYGFHGLSCEYIMEHLRQSDPAVGMKKIIIAHLGSGASMTAVKDGISVDTTMGMTPAGGLVMNTRAGDLDPGIITFLLKEKKLTIDELEDLINENAGLKAMAGKSCTIKELLKEEGTDEKAAEAIRHFCYSARKHIGALAAAMGGLDILVFTGGIGEHAPQIRWRICEELSFLGIAVNPELNNRSASNIQAAHSVVSIYVIPANEELVIATSVWRALSKTL
jgi:acetate kinase